MITETSVFQRRESAVRSYCRAIDAVFTSARGSIMRDTASREYIDFLAGCSALNYGHNDPDMKSALMKYIAQDGIAHGLDLYTAAKRAFLESFERVILAPRGMNYKVQFTGPTGANAVEAAMKLARKVTRRNNIIAFTNGYHGVSLGALAATGNRHHRMGAALNGVTRVPYDQYFSPNIDTAAMLERLLADPSGGIDAPAAILLETVQGEGGLNAASSEWIRRIAELAAQHGALLIVDDIQAGCGRTGTFFSFENIGIMPDLVTMSKSLSGFGLPMAIVLTQPEHDQWLPAEHNGTFRGNTHAFVTARVAIEKFWSDTKFEHEIAAKGDFVRTRLSKMKETVPAARLKGRGMMRGIDVGSGELAGDICKRCFAEGLIIETSGAREEVVKVLAALTTPMELLDRGLGILERAVADAVLEKSIVDACRREFSTAEVIGVERALKASGTGVISQTS